MKSGPALQQPLFGKFGVRASSPTAEQFPQHGAALLLATQLCKDLALQQLTLGLELALWEARSVPLELTQLKQGFT
jgi:hypothetical protein